MKKQRLTTKELAYCALLAALSVVLARMIIPLPNASTRFSIEAIPIFMAGMLFGPVANLFRIRDEEEVLCKMIIVEGVMSIQAGENPKFLRERLMTYLTAGQRDGGGGKKGKKKKGKGGDE